MLEGHLEVNYVYLHRSYTYCPLKFSVLPKVTQTSGAEQGLECRSQYPSAPVIVPQILSCHGWFPGHCSFSAFCCTSPSNSAWAGRMENWCFGTPKGVAWEESLRATATHYYDERDIVNLRLLVLSLLLLDLMAE